MKIRIEDELLTELVEDSASESFTDEFKANLVDLPDKLYNDSYFAFLRYRDGEFTYDLEAIKSYMKNRAAAKRWIYETGGITVTGFDFTIPTSAESQAKIANIVGAYKDEDIPADSLVSFMVGETGVQIGMAQAIFVKRSIAQHVQKAYARQEEIYNWIDDTVDDENEDVSDLLESFEAQVNDWPANTYDPAATE